MAKNQTNKEDFSKYIKTFWKLFLCCIIGVIFLFLFASWGFFGEMPSFEKLENPRNFLIKSANFFCFVLQCTQREHVHN